MQTWGKWRLWWRREHSQSSYRDMSQRRSRVGRLGDSRRVVVTRPACKLRALCMLPRLGGGSCEPVPAYQTDPSGLL